MKKDPFIFIKHILDNINIIQNYMKNKTKYDFIKDQKLQDAIVRRLEIIGEASKNIPSSFRKKYPETPWQNIAGLRDKLIHHYFGVDLNLIYDIVKRDLPKLKKDIEKILKNIK